ncbi:MAG: hypothetical protein Q9M13_01460 [Mariprofundales bacterium]|nr:hypothetical protein [Mariprofundales bacterium]
MKLRAIASAAALAFTMGLATQAAAGGMTVAEKGDSKLKLGGKVFVDFTRIDDTDSTGAVKKRKIGANITRTYLTAKYSFDSDWMFRVTLDSSLDKTLKNGGTTQVSKGNQVFLKYAYLQGKLYGDAAVLRLGLSHTPWIDYEQHLWKHRYFSKVTIDTMKFDASADAGVGLKGKLMDGLVKYWVVAVNGGGYGNTAQTDGIDFNSRVSLYPIKGLTVDLQFRRGTLGKKKFAAARATTTDGLQTMEQLMISYGTHDWRFGGNYIINKDDSGKTAGLINKLANAKHTVGVLWGWANIGSGFGAVARFESENVEPVAGLTATQVKQKGTRTLIGIDYTPVKHINFTLGYDVTKVTNQNYTASGVANPDQTNKKYGLWSQFKF